MCRCDCGAQKEIDAYQLLKPDKAGTRSCGCNKYKRGSNSPLWKGGRTTDAGGYVKLKNWEHPNSDAQGYVFEHVCVMSQHLDRPLRRGETVHHKNGVRDDNRLGNLELWASNHPAGQRIEDQLKWARELLHRYEPPQAGTSAGMLF